MDGCIRRCSSNNTKPEPGDTMHVCTQRSNNERPSPRRSAARSRTTAGNCFSSPTAVRLSQPKLSGTKGPGSMHCPASSRTSRGKGPPPLSKPRLPDVAQVITTASACRAMRCMMPNCNVVRALGAMPAARATALLPAGVLAIVDSAIRDSCRATRANTSNSPSAARSDDRSCANKRCSTTSRGRSVVPTRATLTSNCSKRLCKFTAAAWDCVTASTRASPGTFRSASLIIAAAT
mmetsp:Transcript_98916/g.317161  ORF Transcript_98916/g.317161 Transcript_98916/m.317161 type:complete len:235 (-) Transcript_98916:1558-2262(-)